MTSYLFRRQTDRLIGRLASAQERYTGGGTLSPEMALGSQFLQR